MIDTLRTMLTYCRPYGSRAERKFRHRWLTNLPDAYVDPHANIHVRIGDAPILWSCHTDTVHRQPGRQHVALTGNLLHLPEHSRSTCLGADDTVGVYLAREMILANVEGHYVFHHGEEVGGIGSRALARGYANYLKQFTCAIALDRAGTHDVITHQSGMRCASDVFARSVADILQRADARLRYAPAEGVYTDTAEYVDIIGECSNLSVGYQGQHHASECCNVEHIARLRDALIAGDWSALVCARRPGEIDDTFEWTPWADTASWEWGQALTADELGEMDFEAIDAIDPYAEDAPVAPSIRRRGWSIR